MMNWGPLAKREEKKGVGMGILYPEEKETPENIYCT
jgi:hypothetical protein